MIVTYILVSLLAVFIARYLLRYFAYRKLFHDLPGSKDFRYTTGTVHLFPGSNEDGIAYLLDQARQHCYFHRIWAGPFTPMILAYHPDSVRPVLKTQAPKSRGAVIRTTYDMVSEWVGEGLITANGAKWRRNRRCLTPAFHFDILKQYLDVYNKCADILLDKLRDVSEKGESFNVLPMLNRLALDIILRCAFSYHSDCQTTGTLSINASAVSQLQRMMFERFIKPIWHCELIYMLTSHARTFYELCQLSHNFSDEIINKRKQALREEPGINSPHKVKDFLDILLTVKDADGQGLSPRELRYEVDTFLFAGHETTATGMSWTLYALAEHPEHQEKVYEEVMEVMGDRTDLKWEDLPKLEYTTMCIKEALRMYSVIPYIERRTSEDCMMNGHTIPAGTRVGILLYVMHNNPHVWKDPEKFRPERFHPREQRLMDPYQFVPFSAGPRNCIGQTFAMNEMKTVIAKIVRNFRVTTDPDHTIRRIPTITMTSETGVYLYAQSRT